MPVVMAYTYHLLYSNEYQFRFVKQNIHKHINKQRSKGAPIMLIFSFNHFSFSHYFIECAVYIYNTRLKQLMHI